MIGRCGGSWFIEVITTIVSRNISFLLPYELIKNGPILGLAEQNEY